MCPFLGASRKQPLHRLLSETFSSLWNAAGHHCRAPRFGQRQVQLRDHFGYRPIPEQPHAQDEPNHLLSRQSSTAQRSGARRCQGFFNPLGVDMSAKIFELLWSGEARYRCQRMVKTHRSLLSRSTHHDPQSPLLNVLVAPLKKPSIFDPLALTDRHWSRDRITETHVRFLNRIKDLNARVKLAKRAADEGWSAKMTEERVAKVLAKAHGPRETSKRKTGATYEYDYNGFHCALFGAEVEIGGRRYKMNEEPVDQYLADCRSALQCFVRDVRDRSTAQRASESNGEPASSILPSPAQMLEGLADVQSAGQSLKDILSHLAYDP